MSHEIHISEFFSKEAKYKQLLPQICTLVEGEKNLITNLAQICAALKHSMEGFFWVGFYFRYNDELVLGPFQGQVACSRIKIPNGVCGQAVLRKETIIVDDVNKFPGHIACSNESESEIVVPIIVNSECQAVLDIDSDSNSNFDEIDKIYLTQIAEIISKLMQN